WASSWTGVYRSTSRPLILPATAAFCKLREMEPAMSSNVTPASYSRTLPSGNVTFTEAMCPTPLTYPSSSVLKQTTSTNQKQKSPPSKGRTDCRGSTLLRHRYPQTAIPFPPVSSWRITGASGCRYLPEGLSRFHDSDSQTV